MLYRKFLTLLPWLLLAALVYTYHHESNALNPMLNRLQNYTFDTYQRLHPRENKSVEIYVVDIDEKSLEAVGQWPWPRNKIAMLIEKLFEKGVSSVGLDIVFAEKDGKSPDMLVGEWDVDAQTKQKLLEIPSHDDVLAQVFAKYPVVAGFVGSPGFKVNSRSVSVFDPKVEIKNKDNVLNHVMPGVIGARNIEKLETAAQYHGYFGYYQDTDSAMVRHVPLFFRAGEYIYPTLALATLNAANESNHVYDIETDAYGLKSVSLEGRFSIPIESNGQYRIYYRKYINDKVAGRYISAVDILNEKEIPQNLNAAMVLIGTSAAGTFDLRSTPLDPVVPGVESHIQMLESMYLGEHLTRPRAMKDYELYALIGLGVILLLSVHYFGVLVGLAVFSILNISVLATAAYFFINELILVDVSFILLSLFILYLGQSIIKYAMERASKRAIRNAFSHYLSPEMVKIVSEDPSKLSLGGEEKEITVLFSDIRGFTTMSEGLTPKQLTTVLNRYLTPMTEIVQNHNGTIDKYMGDAVMAFWNAPLNIKNHAFKACAAALEMLARLNKLNEELKKDGLPVIDIGIGLNTDTVTVGNMGSDQRFDYTIMGDGVNLGSRLEGQCKTYGVKLIISESTFNQLLKVQDVSAMYLDTVAVKGKTDAVKIYNLLSLDKPSGEMLEKIELMKRFSVEFKCQQWENALETIKSDLIPLTVRDMYIERISELSKQELPENWDGVYFASTK